jgi:predicted aldo/keto reductase-like oxidoreductase
MYIEGKKTPVRFEFARNVGMQKQTGFANQCVGCGKCESHCPQHIQIRDMLKKADKELRPLPYKVLLPVVRKVMSR